MPGAEAVPQSFWLLLVAVLGLVFGSFVTALTHRLPRGIGIAKGRSACPVCGTTLSARDLIPVISWIVYRGRCRHCGTKISSRYPAIEVTTSVFFVLTALMVTDPIPLALLLALTIIMMTLAVIDIEHLRLPDVLLILLASGGLLQRLPWDRQMLVSLALATAAVALGIVIKQIGRRFGGHTLGMGDLKLIAILALSLPPMWFLVGLTAASLVGVMWGLRLKLSGRARSDFPFGPPLLISLWAGLVIQHL